MLKLDLWKLLLDLKSIASDILRYIFEPAEWIRYIAIYFNLPSEYDTWPADKPPIYLQKSFISSIHIPFLATCTSMPFCGSESLMSGAVSNGRKPVFGVGVTWTASSLPSLPLLPATTPAPGSESFTAGNCICSNCKLELA